MTNLNERTNALLYKNISLTLYSRKKVGCVWEVSWRRGQTTTYWLQVLLTSTSFASCPGCSTVGHWGPKALGLPLALNSASCPQLSPTPIDSSRLWHLVIYLFNVHLLPLFLRLFTQVHLLINGSVEGQYITLTDCISHCTNILGKGINPIILPPAMDK